MPTLPFGKIRHIQQAIHSVESTDLVLVMSQLNGDRLNFVYNSEKPPTMPLANLQAQRLHSGLEFPPDFDGPVVGYASLDLILNDLPTHGINFFNIRDMMKDQVEIYRHNAYRLALTLLTHLDSLTPNRQFKLTDREQLKIIRLALPFLLTEHSLSNLLAIIPTGNLHDFIKQDQTGYKLFYFKPELSNLQIAWQTAISDVPWLIGLEDTQQLLSKPGTSPPIINLRPFILEMNKQEALADTCRSLAEWCWKTWQQSENEIYRLKAYTLAVESWLTHDDVDDLVALFPAKEFQKFLYDGDALRIYRTPRIQSFSPNKKGPIHALGELVNDNIKSPDYATIPIAFPILKPALRFITSENTLDFCPILWRSGRETEVARTLWLLSRDLLRLPSTAWRVINAKPEIISGMAQQAALIYSLQNPWLWRQGRYAQFLKQSYQHLLDCLLNQETLATSEVMVQYFRLLRVWYGCSLADDMVRSLGEMVRTGQTLQNILDNNEAIITTEQHTAIERLTQISERLLQSSSVAQRTTSLFHEVPSSFDVFPFLRSLVCTNTPVLPPSRLFLYWLKSYESLHEQWLAIQDNLAGQRPSFEKLDALSDAYQRLKQLIHAPAHEFAILNWAITQDMQRLSRLKEAIETGPIIKIKLRNPWINPGQRERLRLDIENLGGATAYSFQLELMPSRQFDRFTQSSTLILDSFSPGQRFRLNWEIRAHETSIHLNIDIHYLDHHGKSHSSREVLVIHTRPQGSEQLKPIGNLFQAGPPVAGAGRFFGRQHEIDQIISRLIGGITQPILLRGPRRMGKTSILRQLEWLLKTNKELRTINLSPQQELQLNSCIPVFHTLQSIKDPDDSANFFQSIYEDICESLGLTFDPIALTRQFHRSPTRAFMKQMAQVFAQRPHIRPLVIIDEWDELYRPAYARLAVNLRALMEGEVRVNWVVSSTWTLSEEAGRYGSPFYNQAFTIELGSMAWEAAVELVTLPSQRMGLNWQGEAVVALLELTGRRPYLIQLLCSKLIDYLRIKNSNEVDPETVSVIASQIVREAQATTQYFGFLWKDEQGESLDGVNWMGRLILWALDRHYPRPLTRTEIRETIETELRRRKFSIPRETFFGQEFNDQITQLQWIFDAITLEGDRYSFSIPLVQRWLNMMISQQEDPILQAYSDMVNYRSGTIES